VICESEFLNLSFVLLTLLLGLLMADEPKAGSQPGNQGYHRKQYIPEMLAHVSIGFFLIFFATRNHGESGTLFTAAATFMPR
jgi:hypothetical protein